MGAFHHPDAIYADVSTLSTLPEGALCEGFAEIVKSAVIADAAFFESLEVSAVALRSGDLDALEHVVERCLRIKAAIVEEDERESGRRAVLNFGHTVGHALEAASGYRISHGRAVSVGMVVEARLAAGSTGFPAGDVDRLVALIRAFGLPADWPSEIPPETVAKHTLRDKKAREGRVRYALPVGIGVVPEGARVTREVDESDLLACCRGRTTGRA